MLEASALVIGDEILGGYVTDANSGWLARRLCAHGVPLSWVHTLPDEMAAVDAALSTELARSRPRVIVTSGGIGSTPDDLTYEAVAASLGRDLVENPDIAARIELALDWTREQGADVSDAFAWHMLRMARIPAGATLLAPDAGLTPGVRVDLDGGCGTDAGASIVILPGVPSLFRLLVTDAVEPDLLTGRNQVPTVAEVTHSFPESALNLCFVDVMERFPAVKLGSYPGAPMLVRLTGAEADVAGARAAVEDYLAALRADPGGARLAAAWARRTGLGDQHDRREDG